MADDRTKTSQESETDQAPNRTLGIAAIVIAVAIVVLLVGGGVYWLTSSPEEGLSVDGVALFTGKPADHIELAQGALKGWNVLLISADTTRADRIGCYGNTTIRTPTIDGLASQGVLFRQAITPVPITLPGHASMLTGLIPPRHGVRSNGLFKLTEGVDTLATLLKREGYATCAAIGAFVLDAKFGLAEGFDTYADDVAGGEAGSQFFYPERSAEEVNEDAIPWLREHADKPFFLFVHYFDPHFPYEPPAPFDQQYGKNLYDGEIAYVDGQVSRLLAVLDELDVRKRTLVIFTSDHGEALGEHGERTHAIFIYDATQHVPLIFSAPPPFPQNRIVQRQVGLIDIVPTVAALLGVRPPDGIDGISLIESTYDPKRLLYIESLYPKLTHNWAPLVGLRRIDMKFIHAPNPEVYDLLKDPKELTNIYHEQRPFARRMHERLREILGQDIRLAAVVKPNLDVDEATRRKLEGLGYVVATPSSTKPTTRAKASAPLPDPKQMIRAQGYLLNAQTYVMRGEYEQAQSMVEQYLKLSPDDPEGAHIAGRVYWHLGRLDESLQWYRRSTELGYEPASSWASIGAILVKQGKLDQAEQAYKKALAIDPKSTGGLLGLASLAVRQKRLDLAVTRYKTVLEAGSGLNAGMAYLGLSNVYRKMGKTDLADEMFDKAMQAEPDNPAVIRAAAALKEESGDTAGTIAHLRAAFSAKPTAEVCHKLGRLLIQQGKHAEAVPVLQKGVTLPDASAHLHYELGRALMGTNQIQPAAQAFQRAIQLDGKHADAMTQLGILFARAGQFDNALKLMATAAKLTPKVHSTQFNLGLVLAHLKRYDEALATFRRAAEIDPDDAKTYCKIGYVLTQQGKRDEAAKAYRKALELEPGNAEAQAGLQGLGR